MNFFKKTAGFPEPDLIGSYRNSSAEEAATGEEVLLRCNRTVCKEFENIASLHLASSGRGMG
jgi:hypothetical protein